MADQSAPHFYCPFCHAKPGSPKRGKHVSVIYRQWDHVGPELHDGDRGICCECFGEYFCGDGDWAFRGTTKECTEALLRELPRA